MSVTLASPPSPGGIKSETTTTLRDAQGKTASLCQLPLPLLEAPELQPRPGAIHYVADMDTRFRDRDGFVSSMSKPLEEAAQLEQLIALMETAEKFSSLLYTWRGYSLAMPQLTQPEQHQVALEILEPEMQKLRDFLTFQKDAVDKFKTEINQLVHARAKATAISETRLLTVGRVIASLATLDELKNNKSSIINDYAYYKRAMERSQKRDAGTILEMQEMNMFLATHHVILSQIKNSLVQISGFEDVLCGIVNTSVSWFEEHKYLMPQEKYGLVKVIGYSLYLIDGEKVNINKLHGKKKISLHKIDAIFKEMEIVPLFGDQMIGPFRYIERTPNYDPSHWEKCLSSDVSKQCRLLDHVTSYRQNYSQLIGEITLAINSSVKNNTKHAELVDRRNEPRLTQDACDNLCRISEKCLRALSAWTCNISELFSWKLLHPVDPVEKGTECPIDADVYQRATQYNYSAQEKSAIVELIGMIKSLQSLLLKEESLLQKALNKHMYHQLQSFLTGSLDEALKKASKKNKNIIMSTLSAVLKVSLDSSDSPSTSSTTIQSFNKTVRPSSTQMFLVRTMIESLVTKSDGHKSQRKELDSAHLKSMETFLQSTFFWPYYVNLRESLEACCDLSQLWYREFFLEMTKGGRIQFPIEMSFPWILADHILERRDPVLIQYVLYPLDLYNDSARWALRKFKKQFLFDEIEAEARLCFDQFVYKLSEQIYEQYKSLAAHIILNKSFRTELRRMGVQTPPPKRINYVPLMQQKTIQLLGRSVDLTHLLTYNLNEYFLKSLNVAITRFETSELTSIVELEGMIRLNREAHKLLSIYLPLDDFDALLNEANYCVSSPWGRIALYILLELDRFFLPHFCYNSTTNRFVKTTLAFGEEVEREKQASVPHFHLWGSKNLNTYYTAIYSRYRGFLGPPHFNAICALLSYQDIAMLFGELHVLIKNLITGTLLPYCEALQKVMPKRAAQPLYEYTSPGVLGKYQALLIDIMNYADLKPKVFQCLREIGNGIIFAMQLEVALGHRESVEFVLAGMFQSVYPKPLITKEKDEEKAAEQAEKLKAMEANYRKYNVLHFTQAKGTEEQAQMGKEHTLLSREKLSFGLVLFKEFLQRLGQCLNSSPLWKSLKTQEGAWRVESNAEFHRLWSAMLFTCCWPPKLHELTIEELFGESLHWAGCTLVTLLGQQRRFELMDFCNNLHRIHRVDQKESNEFNISLRKMVDRIRKFQTLTVQIFGQLNKHLLPANLGRLHNDYLVQVEHFLPPSAK